MDDPRLNPLREAMAKVDRAALGFTPFPEDSDIRYERGGGRSYDVMLHLYDRTSRTISFKQVGDGYQWIGEQEIHRGPKEFDSPDGRIRETITITYETVPISGHELNKINISAWSEDPRLKGRRDLTLEEVRPILEEWKNAKR